MIYYKYNLSLLINFLISIRNKVNHTFMLFIHTRYTPVHVNVPPQKPDEMKLLHIPFSIYLQADEIEHRVQHLTHTESNIPNRPVNIQPRNVGTIRDLSSHVSVCTRL